MEAYPYPDPHVTAHLAEMELRGHSPGTIYNRRRALHRMAAFLTKPLLEATPDDLMAWRVAIGPRLGKDATVAYVSHARSFYRWAVRTGRLDHDPAGALPCPRLARRLPRPIPEDQLMSAVAGASPRIRPWLVLAGWAGLRACEIAGLRRENVLDTLRPPALLVAHDATKSRRERVVPLCEFALTELYRAGLPGKGWVFRRGDHQGGPNQPWLISHLANNYLHQAGITATLHQLRHRFGTQAYQASLDIVAVRDLLGHAHLTTTAGYAAANPASALAAVTALPVPGTLGSRSRRVREK